MSLTSASKAKLNIEIKTKEEMKKESKSNKPSLPKTNIRLYESVVIYRWIISQKTEKTVSAHILRNILHLKMRNRVSQKRVLMKWFFYRLNVGCFFLLFFCFFVLHELWEKYNWRILPWSLARSFFNKERNEWGNLLIPKSKCPSSEPPVYFPEEQAVISQAM